MTSMGSTQGRSALAVQCSWHAISIKNWNIFLCCEVLPNSVGCHLNISLPKSSCIIRSTMILMGLALSQANRY